MHTAASQPFGSSRSFEGERGAHALIAKAFLRGYVKITSPVQLTQPKPDSVPAVI